MHRVFRPHAFTKHLPVSAHLTRTKTVLGALPGLELDVCLDDHLCEFAAAEYSTIMSSVHCRGKELHPEAGISPNQDP